MRTRIAIVILIFGLLVPLSWTAMAAAHRGARSCEGGCQTGHRHRHRHRHRHHKRHHHKHHRHVHHQTPAGSAGGTTPPPSPVAVGDSSGALVFSGSFDRSLSLYSNHWGNCYSVLNAQEVRFNISSGCDPGQDGNYRSDINSANIYPVGVPECTTIPVDFPNGDPAGVTDDTWLIFAESEDPNNPNQNDAGSWGMGLTSYFNGNTASDANQWYISFTGYNNGVGAWTGPNVTAGWHTLSLCTNDANNNSGTIYGIWFDGVRQTFNQGPDAGALSLSGFPQLQNDPANESNWPLIIDDYTGGKPANTLIHGAPLVARMGATGLPPEPSGGWNSP